jgi:chromosome segregation ATPase
MRKAILILMFGAVFLLGAGETQPASEGAGSDRTDRSNHRLELAKEYYDRARAEQANAANVVADLRAQIAQDSGRIDVSSEGIRAAVQKMEEQEEQLQLEEAGAAGRRQGLEEAVKKYTDLAKARCDSDPVVTELQKVADLRDRELARVEQLRKVAAVSDSDVTNAEMALAQSRADLAAAKQRAAGGAGASEALDGWNREAMNLSIEGLDRQARLKYLTVRLAQLEQAVAKLPRLDQAVHELNRAETEALNARSRWQQMLLGE